MDTQVFINHMVEKRLSIWNSISLIARSHKILNFDSITLLGRFSIKFTTIIIILKLYSPSLDKMLH